MLYLHSQDNAAHQEINSWHAYESKEMAASSWSSPALIMRNAYTDVLQ
jgi:hypothetical protein